MNRYDLIISGGGMIGAITANAAINAGLKVLLIEANTLQDLTQASDRELRVSAISWENICYLKQLKIFEKLLHTRIHAYHHMSVWDNRSNANIEFDSNYSRQECLGYLIENNNLIQAAINNLNQSQSCEIIQQNKIISLENDGSQVRVELDDERVCKAKLLIAAEGRQSAIRDLVSINTKEIAYDQKGLVAYVKIENAPKETALQAFNEGGPIGILPFGDGLFSIVWSLQTEQVNHWLNCTEDEFEKGILKSIGKDFGEIKLVSDRAAFPLTQLYAEKYFSNRVVLCGDTAHGIHPLAGQGVNLGIGDVAELFRNLDKAKLRDEDLLFLALRKYQRRRIFQMFPSPEKGSQP